MPARQSLYLQILNHSSVLLLQLFLHFAKLLRWRVLRPGALTGWAHVADTTTVDARIFPAILVILIQRLPQLLVLHVLLNEA